MFIFFVCPKKTNQKKGQPITWPRFAWLSCAAHKVRTLRKVAIAPPNRFPALCCAARLRDMAFMKGNIDSPDKAKKYPRQETAGGMCCKNKINQPQPLELQPALLLQPPPPRGLVELIENPDLIPASMKSTLIDPQVSNKLLSTRNVRPSCSYFASLSFGSSRASPKDGPDQPPDIRAIRRAESILFSSI